MGYNRIRDYVPIATAEFNKLAFIDSVHIVITYIHEI